MTAVQAFLYRVPRLALELPIEFCLDGRRVAGRTRNISDTGLLVRLTEFVPPESLGRVRLEFGSCTMEIDAAVVHMELLEVGLHFRFSSVAEQDFIRTLVKVLAMSTRQARSRER